MAATLGADVELDRVPRKYPGLAPWEAWLSEAQERMVLAVPPAHLDALRDVCARYEIELADIGAFTGAGRIVVRHGGAVVADLDVGFLHDGRPTREMVAVRPSAPAPHGERAVPDAGAALLALLAHPNVRSNQDVVTGYDHEVLGGTVVRPYTGACDDGPADAAVIAPIGATSVQAAAIGIGVNTRFGAINAAHMAWSVVDEAIRNAVAVGADPDRIALLDNFSWGDPRRPETLGQLVDAVDACCAAAVAHGAPYVSGKDSLNNEYVAAEGQRHAIPPTLVVHALGVVPDRMATVTSDAKAAGDVVFLIGRTRDELRGSHLDAVLGIDAEGAVPGPDHDAPVRYRRLHAAIGAGLVRAAHDLAEGGLGVAAAEMATGGRLGLDLRVDGDAVAALFSESNGRLLVEVAPSDAEAFVTAMEGDALRLGTVVDDRRLTIVAHGAHIDLGLDDLIKTWAGHVPGVRP
jgi:phosphoribosylformylglycinamidine synthase subunit PurSL